MNNHHESILSTLAREQGVADDVAVVCSAPLDPATTLRCGAPLGLAPTALANAETPSRPPTRKNTMIPNDFDFSKLTPAEAQQLLLSETTIIERQSGLPYLEALNQARRLNPKLVERISGEVVTTNRNSSDTVTLGNVEGVPSAPVFGPGMKATLGLSMDADEQECQAAWAATKGITSPVDGPAVWRILNRLWSGRLQGQKSPASVEIVVADKHPEAARRVGYQKPS